MIVSCLEEITLFVRKRQCFVKQLLIYKTELRDVNGIPLPGVFAGPLHHTRLYTHYSATI